MTKTRRPNPTSDPEARLDRLVRRAALALVWERIWPPLAGAGSVVALFLAVSWAGSWLYLPLAARLGGLIAFALGVVYMLAPLVRLGWPKRAEALSRLDRDSPARHRPASAFEDQLANAGDDPETSALWALHRQRLVADIGRIEVAPPSPRLAWRDPRALRFAALIAAVAAGLVAGPERHVRLMAAFDFSGMRGAGVAARVDAWIDPPAYANKPPMMLAVAGQQAPETVATPEDSVIVLSADSKAYDAKVEGALAPTEAKTKPESGVERRFVVHGDGVFRVLDEGAAIASFQIHGVAAAKPTITLVDPPKPNYSGSLTLRYRIAGAYAAASAEARFDAPGPAKHRLVAPPRFALDLPGGASGSGEANATLDLSASPWAGAEATMTLSVTDAAGRTGESVPLQMVLPQRPFVKPLARALVEQRRNLLIDPDAAKGKLAEVLDALLLGPEMFGTTPSVYLGLHAAASRLARARDDAGLVAVADLIWAMALGIEDGDASKALRDLRAAQQKLREALKNGAGDEEIKKLTDELRQSAERYMQELARNAEAMSPGEQPLDAKDVDSMLDRLEDSALSGARADAEAMLDELQNMFENMRGANAAGESPAERELERQMGELDKLMRDQQALRDDTFGRDQRERARRANPDAAPEPKDDAQSQALAERQQELQQRLDEMKRRMKALGLEPESGFDDAEGDMKEAEGDLEGRGEGKGAGPAVDAQGRALEALRRGAGGLERQVQAMGGGPGGGFRAVGRGFGLGRDPLGRGWPGNRGASEGALHEGPEALQRARRVLEELRRRLADPNRPGEERDYLERLLKPD